MYVPHSITFGEKNTYADWHIVPEIRPAIAPPEPKFIYDDIPGANGSLDLTTSLTGLVNYNDRSGTISFIVLNGYGAWYERYTEIMQYLGGKKMRMILSDEPDFYYMGRYNVNAWTSDQHWSKIDIDYRVEPFKYSVLEESKDFSLTNGTAILRDIDQLTPLTITSSASTVATFNDRIHIIVANTPYDQLAVFPDENGEVRISFTGTVNVNIKYRRTRL